MQITCKQLWHIDCQWGIVGERDWLSRLSYRHFIAVSTVIYVWFGRKLVDPNYRLLSLVLRPQTQTFWSVYRIKRSCCSLSFLQCQNVCHFLVKLKFKVTKGVVAFNYVRKISHIDLIINFRQDLKWDSIRVSTRLLFLIFGLGGWRVRNIE